jgi:hypothetical protein
VARPSSRFAVCAGVAVAVLLIGAPGAAVAVADPGGSGAHSNHADGGNQSERGGNTGRHQSERGGNSAGGRAADQTPNLGNTGPRATAGTARSDTVSGNTSSDQVAEPSAPQGSTTVDGSAATPEAPPAPPVVRFGDGRSPRYEQPVDPPGRSGAPAVAPVQAPSSAVVATPPGRSWIDRHLSPSALLQLDGGPSGPLTDPLLGLAGLVLLPAAAAVLGYRQAKAAQAARALGRP